MKINLKYFLLQCEPKFAPILYRGCHSHGCVCLYPHAAIPFLMWGVVYFGLSSRIRFLAGLLCVVIFLYAKFGVLCV